ncbi:MAG TPA: hypothetical protein ENJ20_04130 [Bacteroidetes bacterium]|nr:hypothetical protein [Bacteroidota bacterium]
MNYIATSLFFPKWLHADSSVPLRNRYNFAGLAFFIVPVVVCLFLLTNCANPVMPEGGPKDETPPRLDTLHSTPNRQVRFEKQDIVLAFDEWVELRDAFNQVVVSPPLKFRPVIKRKKKTIVFQFDDREVLRDSATYVINFGDAIRDLTEGNIAPVVFVFSTGDYIDSLSVEGFVADAYTGEAVEGVLVMLYDNLADSVFRTERPFYFSKTKKDGSFKIDNIKQGRFKVVALVDGNLNYRFDNEAEKIAFLDTALIVRKVETGKKSLNKDSTLLPADSLSLLKDTAVATAAGERLLFLRLFEEEKKLFLLDDDAGTYGHVKLTFNRIPYEATITYDTVGQYTWLEPAGDTVHLWYAMEADTPFRVFVQWDTLLDTVEVAAGLKEKFYEKALLKTAQKVSSKTEVLLPGSDFGLLFTHPLFSIDTSAIHLYEDSLKAEIAGRFFIDSVQQRQLRVRAAWKEGTEYEVELLPGCLTDIFGLHNADTIRRAWKSALKKDFGSLTLRVSSLHPDTAYVVRLLLNDELTESFQVADSTSFTIRLPHLAPGSYSLEIIEDLDRNGRWTTGNYDLQQQPEKVERTALQKVRPNWEVDAEVIWGRPQPTPASAPPKPEQTAPLRNLRQ